MAKSMAQRAARKHRQSMELFRNKIKFFYYFRLETYKTDFRERQRRSLL